MKNSRIVSDSLLLYIGEMVAKFRGLVFLPMIISYIGIKNYGAFVQVLATPNIVSSFASLSLGLSFFRYTSKYDDDRFAEISRDFWTVLLLGVPLSFLGAAVVFFLSELIEKEILHGGYIRPLRLSSVFVVSSVVWLYFGKFLQARRKWKAYSIFNIVHNMMPYVAFVAGIGLWRDIFAGLCLYITAEIAIVTICFAYIVRSMKIRLVRPSADVARKFVRYSWPLVFSNIAGGLLSKADRYFLGYFMGPMYIGIYSALLAVVSLVESFSIPLRRYLAIYLPALWDNGKVEVVLSRVRKALVYYLSVSLGSLLIIQLYFDRLAMVIFKKNLLWVKDHRMLVGVLGFAMILRGANRFYYQIFRYQEKNQRQLVYQGMSLGINAILNYFLIQSFGMLGVALATMSSYLLINLMLNLTLRNVLNRTMFERVVAILLSVAFTYIPFSFIGLRGNTLVLLFLCVCTVLFYVSMLLSFKVIDLRAV